jgi:hypothetical protein
MRTSSLTLLFISLVLLFAGCKKKNERPVATKGGPNFASCYIDGEYFASAPDGYDFSGPTTGIDGGYYLDPCNSNCDLTLDSIRKFNKVYWLTITSSKKSIVIYFNNDPTMGYHRINYTVPGIKPTMIVPGAPYLSYNNKFTTSATSEGWVNFSIADAKTLESMGTFAFTGTDAQGNKVQVTDGQFYYKDLR